MAPTKTHAKGKSSPKSVHPNSRKADQIARQQLRKSRLTSEKARRNQKAASHVNLYSFFFRAIPEKGVLNFDELHSFLRDKWLSRHDDELEEARSARRKGRSKTAKEMQLEEIKLREMEEYRTGFEVPDLTHPENVDLFRRWDQKELGFVQLLRTIRIFRDEPQISVLSKPGRHHTLLVEGLSSTAVTR